jgi:hypothetical protein
MTRTVPLSSSSNNATRHSAAIKKPFRPPLAARPAPTAITSSHRELQRRQQQHQQRQKEDAGKKRGSGADPDSSFDVSFDFDPEALEAAMKKYD